ncbi:hypothetical protein PQQ99_01175 [Paraburkholderia sediminicola]|uniref:hypothetical protein n=1 Tax=Paraburkholderia sediminicola TaxID=458836 RepID=UPI0038BD8310
MAIAKKPEKKAVVKATQATELPTKTRAPKNSAVMKKNGSSGKIAAGVKVRERESLTPEQKAARRLAKARARDDLAPPTDHDILDFQLNFWRKSGLLIYTKDPAVIAAARPTKAEPNERLAGYLDRVFGGRDVPVTFAQFEKREGRESMARVFEANAGLEIQRLMVRARKATRQAVEEAREDAVEEGRKKTKRARDRLREERAQTELELRFQRERLKNLPAEWLVDRADELVEINKSAGPNPVHEHFVIVRLREIANEAREQIEKASVDRDADGDQLTFVVDKLIESLDASRRREKATEAACRQQIGELQAKVDRLENLTRQQRP